MIVRGLIWREEVVDKLRRKHSVTKEEVQEVFDHHPQFRFAESGDYAGEDVYLARGQTEAGRYLVVFFIYKKSRHAMILSARDMDEKERKSYAKKTTSHH